MQGLPVADGTTPMRRNDVRREVSERIQLRRLIPIGAAGGGGGAEGAGGAVGAGGADGAGGEVLDGWALNVSRGGIRCILEENVELGDEFEITIGEEGNAPLTRRGRIVWVQEEADGQIVGVEFLTPSGTHRAADPVDPAAPESPDTPEI